MSEEPHKKFDYGPILLGLFGILCGAIIVVAFHCVSKGWCVRRRTRQPNRAQLARPNQEISTLSIGSSSSSQLLSMYIYSKEWKEGTCAICLSEFTEGEEVRILPGCEHAFHVPCIDMWLYTHPSCPLCRTGIMPLETHVVAMPNSGELPPPIESLPSSRELLPLDNPFPAGSAGLPSTVHNRVSDLND